MGREKAIERRKKTWEKRRTAKEKNGVANAPKGKKALVDPQWGAKICQ